MHLFITNQKLFCIYYYTVAIIIIRCSIVFTNQLLNFSAYIVMPENDKTFCNLYFLYFNDT